ncbi:larval cuticle protein 65Ag1-like [Lucilia sericata]|uniref:larval cuticle protein 65Ag1-like n=1 Tax=Lucilia sericata TaxID=13632 RepID=UPI0018A87DB8|nr:larval cuticle protein 65Ag1-like [Lucilia sericata]
MKFVIVLVALFAVAFANEVEIVRNEAEVGAEGFQYAYETSDGSSADAVGSLKNVGTEEEALSVKGSFKYIGDDGATYEVKYTADENGFQPEGTHLPVAPEA